MLAPSNLTDATFGLKGNSSTNPDAKSFGSFKASNNNIDERELKSSFRGGNQDIFHEISRSDI